MIGSRVRRLRLDAELSQEKFAAKLQIAGWDISRVGIAKIESQIRKVSDAEVIALAHVLSCEVAELFSGVGDPFQFLQQDSSG